MREARDRWLQTLRDEQKALHLKGLPLGLADLMNAFEAGWEAALQNIKDAKANGSQRGATVPREIS